jgi:hypothetical protein
MIKDTYEQKNIKKDHKKEKILTDQEVHDFFYGTNTKAKKEPDFSHWNHRVIYEDGVFGICEVYYDKKIKPIAWTDPIIVAETVEELLHELTLMAGACIRPILKVKGNKLYEKN